MTDAPTTHDRTIDRVQWMNAAVFLLAAAVLFVIAVREESRVLGLVMLVWLALFGSGALWLDHRLLSIARRARGDVPFRDLFGRTLRRTLRDEPGRLFADLDDARAYGVAYRQILSFLAFSCVLLVVMAVAASWQDLADIHYVVFRATAPTL